MRYVLELTYCSEKHVKQAQLPQTPEEAREIWREIADDLMMGKEGKAEALGSGHLVRVSMVVINELDPNDPGLLALSVYRSCADIHPQPVEQKLYIAKGA